MQPHGNAPYGSRWAPQPAPMGPAHHHAPTIAKTPLMPGERVVYFRKPNLAMARAWYFIGGIVLLPVLVGLYLLYVGINFEASEPHYWIITTHRLFTVNARGKILTHVGVHEINNLTHRVGNGTNELTVHSASTFIKFRHEEQHDIRALKPLLENLRNPGFVAQQPSVAFEA